MGPVSGEIVGHVRELSDTLLIFLLKAKRPGVYREHFRHEVDTTIRHEPNVEAVREKVADLIERRARALATKRADQNGDAEG